MIDVGEMFVLGTNAFTQRWFAVGGLVALHMAVQNAMGGACPWLLPPGHKNVFLGNECVT